MQLLNRKPPFGDHILAIVKQLPRYYVQIEEVGIKASNGSSPVEVDLSITCGIIDNSENGVPTKKGKSKFKDATLILIVNSDLDFVDFRSVM